MNYLISLILIFAGLLHCAEKRQYEEYKIKSKGDLILTKDNHPHGFRQADCFYCHNQQNIHQDDTLNTGLIELAREISTEGSTSKCYSCHGDNGGKK